MVAFLLSEEHLHVGFKLFTIGWHHIDVHRGAVNEGGDVAVKQLLVVCLGSLGCKVGMVCCGIILAGGEGE